jgi:uncharacterized membrane protein
MKTPLCIAPDLALPLDAVTQTFGILGKRGGGKSYTAKIMAEEMIKASAHICAVDPIGNWWGLRVAADGKSAGLPITVLGGDYGDAPLEPTEKAGEFVARLIIEEKLSLVIDLSRFRKGEQTAFMIGWAETLYRLNREALHLFIDEADAWAPQRPVGNLAPRLLGAMEDLVRRGRARGLGMTMITQRSASINKDLLTQIEVLIAKRTISPQDRAALEAWIEVHGTPQQQKTMMDSLPSLDREKAWIWSPGWLDLFKCVSIRKLETFDSSATPEVGKRQITPRKLAEVDLAQLRERMKETIEKAKAEDPRELRKQLHAAQIEIGKLRADNFAAPSPEALKKEFERAADSVKRELAGDLRRYHAGVSKTIHDAIAHLHNIATRLMASADEIRALPEFPTSLDSIIDLLKAAPIPIPQPAAATPRPAPQPRPQRAPDPRSGTLGSGERAVLIAIAQHSGGVRREQLTILTGYKRSSRDTYLQRLSARGLIAPGGAGIMATEDGVTELGGDFEPLPTGDALREYWLGRLTGGERKLLERICSNGTEAISRDALDEFSGYKRSARDTYLQRLAARKLIVPLGGGLIRAAEELFG